MARATQLTKLATLAATMRTNGITSATLTTTAPSGRVSSITLTLGVTAVAVPGLANQQIEEPQAPYVKPTQEEIRLANKAAQYFDLWGREPTEAELEFYKDMPTLLG